GSLPQKYRSFRQAWLSLDESKQTIINLTARLLDEEANLNSNERNEKAFVGSTTSRFKKYNEKTLQGKDNFEQRKHRFKPNVNVICHICHKQGHIARYCNTARRNSRYTPNVNHAEAAFSVEDENVGNDDWLMDSGAYVST